ncbi:MAG: glycyl-radical enzyme activating protein [Bacteroidales bacterium]
MAAKGVIFNVQRFSVNDGPGIRTTIFMKGCPLACWWCHNPEGRKHSIEKLNGETIGREITTDELFKIIDKDRVFYEESGGGVTFSGGEPLAQPEFLMEILSACKTSGIHTAIDTSGYAAKALFKKIIRKTDLFLYDLKLMDPVKHLRFAEASNTEILDNLLFLISQNANVMIRIPMIRHVTATNENLDQISSFLNRFEKKPAIALLPFHNIGEAKYRKFNLKYRIGRDAELTRDEIKTMSLVFERNGFDVHIG